MELQTHNKNLFSKLAPEVLGIIFVHCLPPETEPVSSKSGPLLLVQVCHRWRQVAFGTPSLWQIICMDRTWREDPIFILDLFLTKSGKLPLTITLTFDNSRIPAGRHRALVNRIFANFHRVLALKGDTPGFIWGPFTFVKHPRTPSAPRHIHAPLLKHLNASGIPELSEKRERKFVNNRIIAHNLEELHLGNNRIRLYMVSFSPESLKVLTGLDINHMAVISDMLFLCKAINLATLECRVYSFYEDLLPKFTSSVYLPNLKNLDVSFYGDPHQFADMIRCLHCPAIEKLSLFQSEMYFPNFIETLTKGQTPPLRCLHISDARLSSFTRFRDVEELILLRSFHRLDVDETTIQPLIEKDGCKFALFPRLSSFTIQNVFFRSSQLSDLVLTVLKTRSMASGGTLTYAKFQNCEFEDGDEEKIRALQEELESLLRIDITEEPGKCDIYRFNNTVTDSSSTLQEFI